MAVFARFSDIDGESKDANHRDWIDILSLDWGVHHPGAGPSGSSRRRRAAVVEDVGLVLEYEKAAPKLLEKSLDGAVISLLEVELTATYGGARVTYLRYEFKNVMMSSYHVSADGDDEEGPPVVLVECRVEEGKVRYSEFDETGSNLGNVETSWTVERQEQTEKKKKKKKK